ncbi:GntR family transcriptional regulator [Ilumatobacter sp.]|uniref:GntR family transcriptional regulator n=1 Tax=Ilumatobacter sp. TaxID=1967498 RepID=UPI003B52736B
MSTAVPVTPEPQRSMAERAFDEIRRMIIRLDLAPGDVVREADLQEALGIGRTPIREALQRLARDHFVNVIPRRGMFVGAIDVSELSTLYETRAVMEPYVARLATVRGTAADWDEMAEVLAETQRAGIAPVELIELDRRCHEIIWSSAGNRFLTDTLDTLYAQSDRLWHMYLADVADMDHAVEEHESILLALRAGDADRVAELVAGHVRSFDAQVRDAVTRRLDAPLAPAGARPGRVAP